MARRPALAAALVLAVLAVAAIGGAPPAGAHAVVVSSSPSEGQVVVDAPVEVQIQFSERVSAGPGGLTVLDADGTRVDNDDGQLVGSGDLLQGTLQDGLDAGTYVMNYRVVSVDGHPITGAIVFGVGEGTTIDAAGVSGLRAGGDTGFEIGAGIARFVTYVAALLAAGLAIFLAFLHDRGADRRPLAFIARGSAVMGGLGALAVVALQAAILSGDGVSAMTDPSLLRRALNEGLDWATVILLVGLALVHLATDVRKLVVGQALAFYGALAVVGSFVFWGHATNSDPRAVVVASNVVHVAAAAVWFGGLVGLGVVLRSRRRQPEPIAEPVPELVVAGGGPPPGGPGPPTPPPAAARAASTAGIVGRFSTIAAASVCALVVAGAVLAWAETRSLDALTTTTYGRTLMAKVGVVLVVLVAAAYNRYRLVPELEADAADPDVDAERLWTRLGGTAWAEVGGIVVVLALTAALVNITPARTAVDTGAVVNQTAPIAGGQVNLVVAPGATGANTLHIQYSATNGRPAELAQEVTVEVARPDTGIETIEREASRAGPGHFIAEGVPLPSRGTWDVAIVSRLSEFDQERTTFRVPIG
jgi:copper transport protein